MFSEKISLYYNTLKQVKPTQLYHQVYYRLKNRFRNKSYTGTPKQVVPLKLQKGIIYPNSFLGQNSFSFLNLEKQFMTIDWNFDQYGKLWTYNLNYFEFLHQENITVKEGLRLIQNYISFAEDLKDGLEPYPISLRGINWIKFLSENKIEKNEIDVFLYRDYQRLVDNLEYHLLANHLLENGFSLLFGAYYFQDIGLYEKAKSILIQELKEQVLEDGAHYELSPMYHQIILHRVLDCYNLVKNNSWKRGELLSLLKEKAELMLGWLNEISFRNGEIPKLNDAANEIAPTTKELLSYAEDLGLKPVMKGLSDSGYRKFGDDYFEIVADVGQIAPSYQPGHSHADSLQFVMNYKNKPIVVDTGISTYEKNDRRQLERSTISHNTVTIKEQNSSNVWGGFRIAQRARVSLWKSTETELVASHNGYRNLGVTHKRSIQYTSGIFRVEDQLLGNIENLPAEGHLHFHPDVDIQINKQTILINENLKLEFSGINDLQVEEYQFAEAFNKLQPAKKIIYRFTHKAELLCQVANTMISAADRIKTDATFG
ncbi:alginate lyase family protein [Gramella sp. KN1008]|uniref:alginate lyase family protein n=1 Tax=Gramella sp. KN1008 TaxID=2529298 RepID=UPI001040A083|nr:alginate lyase family protein [Gramella sp. KN1008]TBW30127.1 alginate lyase family protein [Gramella sp. KN1008]